MKKTIACAALLAAAFTAHAELERISLDGTWDFSFARDAKLSSASSDFKATDKMVVPGCFDLMPKWYAQRGLAHYRRTFALDKQTKDAWLVVKGMGLQAKFFIDGESWMNIQIDAIINAETAGPVCMELMVRTSRIIDATYSKFMHEIWA